MMFKIVIKKGSSIVHDEIVIANTDSDLEREITYAKKNYLTRNPCDYGSISINVVNHSVTSSMDTKPAYWTSSSSL
jgi:hypothetical protein